MEKWDNRRGKNACRGLCASEASWTTNAFRPWSSITETLCDRSVSKQPVLASLSLKNETSRYMVVFDKTGTKAWQVCTDFSNSLLEKWKNLISHNTASHSHWNQCHLISLSLWDLLDFQREPLWIVAAWFFLLVLCLKSASLTAPNKNHCSSNALWLLQRSYAY